MDEFIVSATLFEGDSIKLKTYGYTIEEAVDNLVQLQEIQSIESIVRKRDGALFTLKDKYALTKLREIRDQIENESLLTSCLSNLGEIQ